VGKKSDPLASKVPVREKLKELGGLFFFLCAMFVFISLVTYDAGDIREVHYPANSPLHNKGGAIGARVGYALLSGFGIASYLLVFFIGFWSFVVFFRRKLDGLYVKLVAVMVSVFAAATLLSLQGLLAANAFGLGGTAPGLGGVYGKAFEILLVNHLGGAGAWLCVILALAVSLVLSTDWMIYVGLLKLAAGAQVLMGRISHHYSAEELARRRALAEQAKMERAKAELARRVAAEAAAKKAPAPAAAPVVAAPAKPAIRLTNQDRAIAAVIPPSPVPAPAKPVAELPAPKPAPAGADAPVAKPAPALKMDAVKAEPSKVDLASAVQKAASSFKHSPVGAYTQPPIDLFDAKVEELHPVNEKEIKDRMLVLEAALAEYGIDGKVVNFEIGPAVTQYEIQLAPGQQIHAVTARQDEITMRLSTLAVRVVAPLPGKGTVGIEVPNPYPKAVRIREFLEKGYADLRKIPLPMVLGKTNEGGGILRSLAELPHLLIGGTTGSGKSVCLKTIITSLVSAMSPQEMKLILIDPKQVELTSFTDIPHLWAPVVTDGKKAGMVLDWLVKEMEERYGVLNRVGATSITAFNKMGEKKIRERLGEAAVPVEEQDQFPTHMPFIVAIIDELADLMMTGRKEVETSIVRLAQKARAIGIHLIVATQRPSTDVITGLIRSNMPSRIAFRVPSQIESRIIMDKKGAERLLGKGDMLVKMIDAFEPVRGQCTFVSDDEIRGLVKWLRGQGKPEYHQELIELKTVGDAEGTADDDLFEEAVELVLREGRGSTSLIQRAFSVGYSRAARLIDAMAKMGIVGQHNGSNAREIQITLEQWQAMKNKSAAAAG
jgi:S-DNA-T family DNA segregation ATPase FtsK/SpoIIIE